MFRQNNSYILGVAHAKINTDFKKFYKRLNLLPDDDDHVKHVKSFTKPDGTQMSGRGSMVTTCCKIFFMRIFSREFNETILIIFNMEPLTEEDEHDASGHLASQDFPQFSQSRGLTTLRVCLVCKFTTRSEGDYASHMESHPKCMDCGFFFTDDAGLDLHKSTFLIYVNCDICFKDVLEGTLVFHKNGHQTTTGYKKVVSKGKVKIPKEKHFSEASEKTISGYFLKTMRPKVRSENPGATP